MPRLLSPLTNPNGYLSAAGAVFAVVVMITNAVNHHGIIDPPVIVAAVGAVGALFARQQVTPVKDPKDGNGNPLVPVPAGGTVTVAPAVSQAEMEKWLTDSINGLVRKGRLNSPLTTPMTRPPATPPAAPPAPAAPEAPKA